MSGIDPEKVNDYEENTLYSRSSYTEGNDYEYYAQLMNYRAYLERPTKTYLLGEMLFQVYNYLVGLKGKK